MEKIILSGIPVYTSEKLRDQFKKMIDKKGDPTSKKLLIELVDTKILIPVINEPNKLKQLIMKIRKIKPIFVLGNTWKGKAYVIFHPNQSPQTTIDTALHEVMHVSHRQNPKQFNSINMNIYVQFYSFYIKELFKTDIIDKNIFIEFIKRLTDIKYVYYSTYDTLLPDMVRDHSRLKHKQIKERAESLASSVFNYLDKNIFKLDNRFVGIPMRKTYRYLFKTVDYQSDLGQELYNPAEIICILSTIKPDHPNIIKSLKLIKPGKKPIIKNINKKIIKTY